MSLRYLVREVFLAAPVEPFLPHSLLRDAEPEDEGMVDRYEVHHRVG